MLILEQEPSEYTPAYNQSPWVIRESDTSGTLNDWRMLIEVYDANEPLGVLAATFTIRFRAGTDRRVVFDPSRILQNMLSYDHAPLTSTYAPWAICENSIQWYALLFSSQKYIAGKWVTQNQFTRGRKCVYNASMPVYTFIGMSANEHVSYQGSSPIPLTSYLPTIRDISSTESMYVHFLSGDEQAPLSMTLTKYPLLDLQGTPLTADPVYVNPFGLSFTGFPTVDGNEFTRRRIRAGVGTKDFDAILSPPSFVGVQSYKVDFLSTGSATPTTFAFNINNCSKYTPTRLHWLNTLGGFDAYTFKLKSSIEDDIKRETYVQQPNVLSNTGEYGYNYQSRGRTEYHTRIETTQTINSDNLTDDEMIWLRGLISSPVVFLEFQSIFIAVNLETKTWKELRGVQDGVFQIEVKFKAALDSYTQAQ
jgi:hypothetical protein